MRRLPPRFRWPSRRATACSRSRRPSARSRSPRGPIPRAARHRSRASSRMVEPLADDVLGAVLALIGAQRADLDPAHPPRLVFAGNRHPLVVLAAADLFDAFTFDPVAARALMDAEGWPATIIVLRDLGDGRWDARNIFPVGTPDRGPRDGRGRSRDRRLPPRDRGGRAAGAHPDRAGPPRGPAGTARRRCARSGRHHRVGNGRPDRLRPAISPRRRPEPRPRCRGCRRARPSCRPSREAGGCGPRRRPS